jgi:DNA-binding GntR family transcriptional regulator
MESLEPSNVNALRDGGVTEPQGAPAVLAAPSDPLLASRPTPKSKAAPDAGHLPWKHAGAATQRPRRLHRTARTGAEASGPRAIPVRERAYSRLRALVLSGRIAPGQRLAEEHLAKEFGISRTPIREALHKLGSEGLITSVSTRGFATFRDSQAEMVEFNDLRAALEGYALRVICGRLTEGQLQRLERTVQMTEDALRRQRLGDVSRWNTQFHAALHEMISDKHRLYRQLVTMRQYACRYRENAQPEPESGRWTVEGHRRILMALRFHDADLCECAMRDHIQQSVQWPSR